MNATACAAPGHCGHGRLRAAELLGTAQVAGCVLRRRRQALCHCPCGRRLQSDACWLGAARQTQRKLRDGILAAGAGGSHRARREAMLNLTCACCMLHMPAPLAGESPAARQRAAWQWCVAQHITAVAHWRPRNGKQPGPHLWQAVVSVHDILQVGPCLIPMVGIVVWCSQVLVLVLHHLSIHGAEPACGVRPWGLCSMLASRYCAQPYVSSGSMSCATRSGAWKRQAGLPTTAGREVSTPVQ